MRNTNNELRYAYLLSRISDIVMVINKELMNDRIEPKPPYIKVTPDGEFSVLYGEEDKGWLDG